jgi:hypothetical protein
MQVLQQQRLLLQQQQQMQHYMVRLSVKLHGVTPEQLPSSIVQALEQLVLRYAGHLDAVMVNPAFRRGCVQMEFDLLVKPQGVAAGPAAAAAAAAGDNKPGQQTECLQVSGDLDPAAAAGGSKAWAGGRAAGRWGHVLDALSSCPGTAAAEDQLRAALPFTELLQALLLLPVACSIVAAEAGAGGHEQQPSSSSAVGDAQDGRNHLDSAAAASAAAAGNHLASAAAADADGAASHTVGGYARAIYAQIGDCLGIWTADKGLVQDWAPAASGLGHVQQHTAADSSDSSDSSSGSADSSAASVCVDGRPRVTEVSMLCTTVAAAAAAAATPAEEDSTATSRQQPPMQPVPLELAVQPGSTAAHTGSHSGSEGSWGSITEESSKSELNLWCTSRGSLVPLASRPAADDAAVVASDAMMSHHMQVLLGLSAPLPGLLLLQAEQLTRAARSGDRSTSSTASSRYSSQAHKQQLLEHEPEDYPLPLMSRAVPVVICPSSAMADEVSALLSGSSSSTSGSSSSSQTASLLQQLGLLLDFWSMWQQQQQLGDGQVLSQCQLWQRSLLGKPQYLDAMR